MRRVRAWERVVAITLIRRISTRWCDDGLDAEWSLKWVRNWHWLFEILESELSPERIVLANRFKTRIIAESQIETDKVDARILADLLRVRLISSVHVVGRESRRDQGGAAPALFFRPATHDAAQSHSSAAWRASTLIKYSRKGKTVTIQLTRSSLCGYRPAIVRGNLGQWDSRRR